MNIMLNTKDKDLGQFDLIIIGGGAAGLSAGIYAARAGLKTLLLEKGFIGGLVATVHLIENYPGFTEGIGGMELMEKMKAQAERFGTHIIQAEVQGIRPVENRFEVLTDRKNYRTSAIIVASGTEPKKLNVPGEDELRGRGVSYCATCDGPLFKDRDIAVIGCGNAGLQEGYFLLKFVSSITFIEILPYIAADMILQERLQKEPRGKFMLNHKIVSINGKDRVVSITVRNQTNNEEKIVKVSGIFIYIGLNPFVHYLRSIVDLDADGFVITDEHLKSSRNGIFAAGDVRSREVRQVVTACADGAIAAINAHHYIASLNL